MSDSATYTTARLGNGTAVHLAAESELLGLAIICNRWGSTNGQVRAPKVVKGAEATCKRCLRIAAEGVAA